MKTRRQPATVRTCSCTLQAIHPCPRARQSGLSSRPYGAVAQFGRAPRKRLSQVRLLSIVPAARPKLLRNGRKTTPAERGAWAHRLRCNPKPTSRQPVAVCTRPGCSPCPQPATLPPCLQGSNHGALQGPRLRPLEPRLRCNGNPIATKTQELRTEKKRNTKC